MRFKQKDSHVKDIHTLISEESHMNALAYMQTTFSRVVRSFKQL